MRFAKRTPWWITTVLVSLVAAGTAGAANIPITWLSYSPTAINSTIPNNSVYFVPGIGNVTVTYSFPANFSTLRAQLPSSVSGSVTSGGNTYSWTNYEYFGTIFTTGALGPVGGTITYTFTSQLAAGSLYVGTIGLGATSNDGTGASGQSSTVVNQNGTFLGDFNGGDGFGASAFTGGVGTFTVKNSTIGAGGADPWWNTQLGVTRINDPVTSITINQNELRGDGIGVNIGFTPDLATPTQSTSWGRLKNLYR